MAKRISATEAKNNFGALLEDVAMLGRVDIVRHGRLVAVVLSPLHVPTTSELRESARPARPVPTPPDFEGPPPGEVRKVLRDAFRKSSKRPR